MRYSKELLASLSFFCVVFSCDAIAQENRKAVEAAREGQEVQQKTHPLLAIDGPYEATWESLEKHKAPQWFLDAKVGFSMHWGPYAVPAWATRDSGIGPDSYSEWYFNRLRTPGTATQRYHRQTYGDDFEYDQFIPMFTAENFDADEWMRSLAHHGVKYFFITSKHHDGFCLWDTKFTNRNSANMGPKRDILRELVDAARKHGVKIGFYYSFYEWYNPIYIDEFHGNGWLGDREAMLKLIEDKQYTGVIDHEKYVDDFMIPQIVELIDNFHPDYLCFDGEWDYPESYWKGKQIAAYYYNQAAERGQEVVLNDRLGKGTRGRRGDFYHVEYHANVDRSLPWAMWRGLGKSFGHNLNEDPDAFLTPEQTVRMVVDCVSSNGNIEFNVGPTKDGRIDQPEWSLIQHMGAWLRANGESIYGAAASPLEGFKQGKVTHKPTEHTLYLHVYDWPDDGVLKLPGVTNPISSARLLSGAGSSLGVQRVDDSLVHIEVPKHPTDPFVSVVAVTYDGELEVKPHIFVQSADAEGKFRLRARDARLTKNGIRVEDGTNAIGYWARTDDYPTWRIDVPSDGEYQVVLNRAAPRLSESLQYAVLVDGNRELSTTVKPTGSWRAFADRIIGTCRLQEGTHDLSVRKLDTEGSLMNLRSVELRPAKD